MNLKKLSAFMQIVCFVELSALRFLAVFQNVCLFKADDDSMSLSLCTGVGVWLHLVTECKDSNETEEVLFYD